MHQWTASTFLRRILLTDALVSAATGLLMTVAAGWLTGILALPTPLLRWAGLVLLPYGALVALLGTRAAPRRWAVWAVIVVNCLWAIDSVVLLVSGLVTPSALGYAFVIAQAVVVAVFAELQYSALRRAAPPLAERAV